MYDEKLTLNHVLVYSFIVFKYSPVENQNDLDLDFKVFFFIDSCC